jgi:hypothetical protein
VLILTPVQQAAARKLAEADQDHFVPEVFFRRPTLPVQVADVAAVAGVIRGPIGGTDEWLGRSATQTAARQIRNSAFTNHIISKIPSRKYSGLSLVEASREADLFKLLDWAPNVKSVKPQPDWIHYHWLGRDRKTCPDFAVELHSGKRYLLEVKPPEVAADTLFKMKSDRIAATCLMQGWIYAVVSDDFIRRQPRLNNVKRLARYRHSTITAATWSLMVSSFEAGAQTVGTLASQPDIDVGHVYSAIFRNALTIDIHEPLSLDTRVSL